MLLICLPIKLFTFVTLEIKKEDDEVYVVVRDSQMNHLKRLLSL